MTLSGEGFAMLAKKYEGYEFAVYDMKSARVLGPWSKAMGAVYSARDEAGRMTGNPNRFVVKKRVAQ